MKIFGEGFYVFFTLILEVDSVESGISKGFQTGKSKMGFHKDFEVKSTFCLGNFMFFYTYLRSI